MHRTTLIVSTLLLAAACASPTPPSLRPLNVVTPVRGASAPTESVSTAPASIAAGASAPQENQKTPTSTKLAIGLGLTNSPDATLIGGSLDLPLDESFTWGPALQVGLDDDRELIAPMVQLKRFFPLSGDSDFVRKLLPYAMGGAGIVYLNEDTPTGSEDDTGFLLAVGGGIRYAASSSISFGSQILINFVPGEVNDEGSYMSWEIVQLILDF